MNKKLWSIVPVAAVILFAIFLITLAYIFQPHVNVATSKSQAVASVEAIVNDFIANPSDANANYFNKNGKPVIVVLEGTVFKIEKNETNNINVLLKEPDMHVGIKCLFSEDPVSHNLNEGDKIKVKGILISGPSYDEDLSFYENGFLTECLVLENIQPQD